MGEIVSIEGARGRRAAAVALFALAVAVAVFAVFPRVGLGPLPLVLAAAILAAFCILVLVDRSASITAELGLDRPAPRGIAAGLVMALPMAGALALSREVVAAPSLAHALRFALATALAEEIAFRGLAFRLLARRARWGAPAAAIVTAVAFAIARVASAAGTAPPAELVEIALLGAATAGWLAWLFAAWGDSLWVPLALHFGMNFAWALFQGALVTGRGDPWGHVGRLASFAASVALTAWARRRGKT
ncbi:MAG TPA: CPBP family intramembrane glutamic endopeptidase [Minicystis sp.]|nr:CPBP family intramembrane glutamic endopeptidase [Minicystis sp.]